MVLADLTSFDASGPGMALEGDDPSASVIGINRQSPLLERGEPLANTAWLTTQRCHIFINVARSKVHTGSPEAGSPEPHEMP